MLKCISGLQLFLDFRETDTQLRPCLISWQSDTHLYLSMQNLIMVSCGSTEQYTNIKYTAAFGSVLFCFLNDQYDLTKWHFFCLALGTILSKDNEKMSGFLICVILAYFSNGIFLPFKMMCYDFYVNKHYVSKLSFQFTASNITPNMFPRIHLWQPWKGLNNRRSSLVLMSVLSILMSVLSRPLYWQTTVQYWHIISTKVYLSLSQFSPWWSQSPYRW